MKYRLKFITAAYFLSMLPSVTMAEVGSEESFRSFHQPGALQNYFIAQNQAAKKSEGPPSPESQSPKTTLNLDSPNLSVTPEAPNTGPTVGVFSNIVFGGTIDYRALVPKEMPQGMLMIHVNELFLTTNIGDHISILAEQLLLTSDLATAVGQDHGFVYATISNLSYFPEGTAFRIGRLRLKYGIDSKLDGPANPLRTPEYRTIGLLSDRAIEASGYFSIFEYVVAVSMGPDFVLKDVLATDGTVAGPIKADANNTSHPVTARIGTDLKNKLPNFGVSVYTGNNYRVTATDGFQASDAMIFGGLMSEYKIIYKERQSVDGRWDYKKFRFSAEYTIGRDFDDNTRYAMNAFYFRSDINLISQKLNAQVQYDRFHDGRPQNNDIGSVGLGLTYLLTDQCWLRGFYQGNERIYSGASGGWVSGTQLLLAF